MEQNNTLIIKRLGSPRLLFGEFDYTVPIVPDSLQVACFYYIRNKGDHGLEYLEGHGDVLDWLFRGSMIYCPGENKFYEYDNEAEQLAGPTLFLGRAQRNNKREKLFIELTLHGENRDKHVLGTIKSSLLSLSESESEADARRLASTLLNFDFSAVWLHGPLRPLVASNNLEALISEIEHRCASVGVNVVHSDIIPDW